MNASGMYPKIEILEEVPLENVAEELSADELEDDECERPTIPAPPINHAEFQKSQEYRDFWTMPKVR